MAVAGLTLPRRLNNEDYSIGEVQVIEFIIKYGPCAAVVWFMIRDWQREQRMAKALDEAAQRQVVQAEVYAKNLQEISVSTIKAINDLRIEIAQKEQWDGHERRKGG